MISCPCLSCSCVDPVPRVDPVHVFLVPMLIPCLCWSTRAHVVLVHVLLRLILFPWSHACVDLVLMFILIPCTCCSCACVVLVYVLFLCTWCSHAHVVLVHLMFLCTCCSCPNVISGPGWFYFLADPMQVLILSPCPMLIPCTISCTCWSPSVILLI